MSEFDQLFAEDTYDWAGRDVSSLSASQRSNRSHLALTLANYRDRGVFPHNYDFPGQSMPYFIDRKTGTLCAVAHLLESTGRRDIVDRVARQNNNVWVAELAGDSALSTWLDVNGVTFDEAARIQVPYEKSDLRAVGFGVMAVGGLGLFTATESIHNHNQIARTQREEEARRRVAEATWSPMITGSLANPGVGATLSLRF